MKANELQLKDWVLQNGYPSRVVLLINNYIETETMADDREPCTFEPVPLTEEILKANGLDPITYCDLSMPKWFMSIRSGNNHVAMPFRYVHELQHALRLCGLADLADNFKV